MHAPPSELPIISSIGGPLLQSGVELEDSDDMSAEW